jgi:hypothetical protein
MIGAAKIRGGAWRIELLRSRPLAKALAANIFLSFQPLSQNGPGHRFQIGLLNIRRFHACKAFTGHTMMFRMTTAAVLFCASIALGQQPGPELCGGPQG